MPPYVRLDHSFQVPGSQMPLSTPSKPETLLVDRLTSHHYARLLTGIFELQQVRQRVAILDQKAIDECPHLIE